MSADLWIATGETVGRGDLADGWLRAGTLDTFREKEVWRVVQGYLGSPRFEVVGDVLTGHAALLAFA